MTVVVIIGLLLSLCLMQLKWLLFPAVPDYTTQIGRWERARERAAVRAIEATPASPMGKLARWVIETLHKYRPHALAGLHPDLAIIQRDLQTWMTKVIGLSLLVGAVPIVAVFLRRAQGKDGSLVVAVLVGMALAVFMVNMLIRDLREEAGTERRDYLRVLSLYQELVAVSMEAGHGHAAALPAAAQIGSGRVFREIQMALDLAPAKGITAWEALGELGERYRIPELATFRSTMNLGYDDGASVKDSMIARADTMRSAWLASWIERANNATAEMRVLIILAAAMGAVYIFGPLIVALRSASTG